ncbi:hypothetical protein [Bradyrhizobium icense]|uniref:Uncharacterized protein n=1 Tax=Bradyrhizobium icense TaxID=1274631 RepID=A0A1B1UCV1_9BRAD|nr:hypothetical protein [Bradyrhizobium icense]ANW00587.1 hypothetical protein LMTR13_10835 [Bradyrhizobium icense]
MIPVMAVCTHPPKAFEAQQTTGHSALGCLSDSARQLPVLQLQFPLLFLVAEPDIVFTGFLAI